MRLQEDISSQWSNKEKKAKNHPHINKKNPNLDHEEKLKENAVSVLG